MKRWTIVLAAVAALTLGATGTSQAGRRNGLGRRNHSVIIYTQPVVSGYVNLGGYAPFVPYARAYYPAYAPYASSYSGPYVPVQQPLFVNGY